VTDADGVVRHRTQTGRLAWEIQADGFTTVKISRPSGPIASVQISPDGQISVVMEAVALAGEVYTRHLRAVTRAVKAVVAADKGDLSAVDVALDPIAQIVKRNRRV
jgi:hypothetical protein